MTKKLIGLLVLFLVVSFNYGEISPGEEEVKSVLRDLSFDKKTGAISYELTVPAWVRVRFGIADGPLYRTIVDWQERNAGKHKEDWDGMDSSGNFKLVGRDDLVFTFNYFTEGDEYLYDVSVADILPLAGNLAGRHLPNLEINRIHKSHNRKFCHEPKIEIRLPENIKKNKQGFYIIKEKLPIEISLADEDKTWFRVERFSLHIFLDDVFLQGELDGYSPYTWIFDPKGLNEGKHLIVVNLAGFADHYGIAGIPIFIDK
jgi:hypothetical protein